MRIDKDLNILSKVKITYPSRGSLRFDSTHLSTLDTLSAMNSTIHNIRPDSDKSLIEIVLDRRIRKGIAWEDFDKYAEELWKI